MNIRIIEVQNNQHHRQFTGADWYFMPNGDLVVTVSKLSDPKMTACLKVHELVEALLCHFQGVTVKQVDDFDEQYEKTHTSDLNAGDDPAAPYRRQHCFATAAERIVAAELGIDWPAYDKELEAL